jgi:uncharacterized protein (TIGR02145 family)
MKRKNRLFIYTFIFFGFLIANIFSCKEDESIIKKDPVIAWANPADIVSGTLLSATQLNATADVAGSFVYTPAIGTQLAVGTNQNLKADFTPTDNINYNTASKTVKITVNDKQDPIITWANPADIVSGTLLSAAQLNATADVAGAFVYTPAIGTQLAVGTNQDLKADFTPTDLVNYNTVSKTVKINVTAAEPHGTVTDADGNVYQTITIDTQVWMVENLKVTHYQNGDPVDSIYSDSEWSARTTGAFCDYNNDAATGQIYGKLYNWFAVSDSRKIAPSGWHVATDDEWTRLTNYLGGGTIAGGKLKESGLVHWLTPNEGATNERDFTALPGGYRESTGSFNNLGKNGYWWTSNTTAAWDNLAWYKYMYYDHSYADRWYTGKTVGYSVRCVMD